MPSGCVSLSRARRALRLVCEVREIGVGTEEGRKHLVAGIAHEIGAIVGGAILDRSFGIGLKSGLVGATLFGFDAQLLPVLEAHHVHGSQINPVHRTMMKRRTREPSYAGRMTYAEHLLLTPREWDAERWVTDYVRPSQLDHFLGSTRVLAANKSEGVGLMRAKRDRPFSQEDCDILDLILSECGPLFGMNDHTPASERPKLAPRVRATLERLLTGATDKEIASQLGMSHHTVRDYLKKLYRAYGVTTRGQLIALVLRESAGTRRA